MTQAAGLPSSPIHGYNPWPQDSPAFTAILKQHVAAMLEVGRAVMRGLALALGLQEDFFENENTAGDPYWVARIIHYPPLQREKAAEGA